MAGMEIQTQIRHNAEEIRSYFEDLKKWEEEMRKKDKVDKVARAVRKADGGPSRPCKGPEPCKGIQATKANKAVSASQAHRPGCAVLRGDRQKRHLARG